MCRKSRVKGGEEKCEKYRRTQALLEFSSIYKKEKKKKKKKQEERKVTNEWFKK